MKMADNAMQAVEGRKPSRKEYDQPCTQQTQFVTFVFDKYGELAEDKEGGTVFISHADCMNDVNELKNLLKTRYNADVQIVADVGPVIGAHSGPGTLALFFVGRER